MGDNLHRGERLLRGPLAAAAAAFAAGIACENRLNWHGAAYAIAAGALAAVWLAIRWRDRWLPARITILLAVAFVLGGWRIALDRHALEHNHVAEQLGGPDGRIIALRGRVDSRPMLVTRTMSDFPDAIPRDPNTVFLLAVEATRTMAGQWQPATGLVRVHCAGPALHLEPGSSFERVGLLLPVRESVNFGQPDSRQASIDRRLLATFYIPTERDEAAVSATPHSASLRDLISTRAHGLLLGRPEPLHHEDRVLLDDLILGRRGGDEQLIAGPFLRTGTYHYLAISGLHMGILAGVSFGLLRILRVRPRRSALIVLLLVAGYCLMAEPRPPILRACVMVALGCLGLLLYREPGSVNTLGAAAMILLLISPGELFGAGFQLSFIVVLGLLLFAGPFYRWLFRTLLGCKQDIDEPRPGWLADRPLAESAIKLVLQIVAVATIAWLVGLPLTAYYFHRFYPWSILSSIALWGPIWATLTLSFAKMAMAAVTPSIAAWLNGPLHSASATVLGVTDWLDRVPNMSVTVGQPGTLTIVAFYAYLLLWHVRPRWLTTSRMLAIGLAGSLAIAMLPGRNRDRMELTVLDVGNGLCQAMHTPDGQTVLFDCGSLNDSDMAEQTVVPYLASRHDWYEPIRIRTAFVSHANLDHYNGLPGLVLRGILDDVRVGPAMAELGNWDRDNRSRGLAVRLGRLLDERQARVRVASAGDQFKFGQTQADLLWPPTWVDQLDQQLANDTSQVVRLTFAGRRILLTGDASEIAIRRLLDGVASGELDLRADVLVMPHHGAIIGDTDAFIRAVNPAVVIISSRRRLDEILPRSRELRMPGRDVLVTSEAGAVSVRVNATGQLTWRAKRK